MSVHVIMNGRLGNNLFQYALGRIIAERHSFALTCSTEPLATYHLGRGVDVGGPTTLESLRGHFPSAPLRIQGLTAEAPVETYHLNAGTEWNGQAIPFDAMMSASAPRKISLYGYFQRFEYFADHLPSIYRWFRCVPRRPPVRVGPRDVVLCVRRGFDYGVLGWTLPTSYYREALRRLSGVDRVWVCGTGIDGEIREALANYGPTFFTGGPIEQFIFIQQFRRIVLSNSTFSWWAGLLSDATEIYAPFSATGSGYAFSGFEAVDLHMRQSRYRELPVPEFVSTSFRLRSRICGATSAAVGGQVVVTTPGGLRLAVNIGGTERSVVDHLLWHSVMTEREYNKCVNVRRRRRLLVHLVDSGMAEAELQYNEPVDRIGSTR